MSNHHDNTRTTVVNETVISASPDEVWQVCTDVEQWPRIFPSVRDNQRTEVGPGEILMEMTVSNDLGDNVVRSRRKYVREQWRIDFEMETLPPDLATMDGDWTIEPTEDGSKLVIVHNFTPRPKSDASSAELATTLRATTDDVLSALKAAFESDADGDGLRDAWGPRTAGNGISAHTFETCELFFSRLGLAGLDWGDITMVLKNVHKESTHSDWADWHRRWTARGGHYERRAREAFRKGFAETGRVSLQRAAACHHYAEFFYFDDPDAKKTSRAKVTEVFEQQIPYLREQVSPLTIPYEGQDLPGYVMTPPGDGPWPCVMLVNGLDSAKEVELHAFARELLARGMGAIVFDGPGQGLLAGQTPMVVEFERVVDAVMREVRTRPEVDADRIGIFGVSFGGYLAARAAASVPGFRACVNLSGGFDHDNYLDINSMVRTDFRFVFDVADDEAMAAIAKTSLHLRDAPRLRIPLLAIHGELDSIIPMESCERMLDWAAGETELIRYPGERHVATNYFGDFIPRFSDWLAQHLGVVQR